MVERLRLSRGGQRPARQDAGGEATAGDTEPDDSAPAPPDDQASPRRPCRILVVDDNELNRDLLTRRLERSGHEARAVDSGQEALEQVAARRFDLVLLDIMMPDMDGFQVLEALRRDHSMANLPVIMATARTASDDLVRAMDMGANDYVTKPLDMPVVLARIASQLSLKEAREQVEQLNARVAEAHAEIYRLAGAAATPEGWAPRIAPQVAHAVGAGAITVWLLEGEELRAVAGQSSAPPAREDLARLARTGQRLWVEPELLVPVAGLSRRLQGAIQVADPPPRSGKTELQLLDSFGRQLGELMEQQELQRELATARDRRDRAREQLLARGIDLLQVCPRCSRCYSQEHEQCDHDGAVLRSLQVLPLCVADRYELTSLVGQGGMGLVFRARDLRLERDVALKVLKSELFNNQQVRARFEREAQLAARVDHEGVVNVHDYGSLPDGSRFQVLELLRGSTLARMIADWGVGTPQQVARLLRQGAAGLGAAHRMGLLHRDIKPDNIFLTHAAGGFQAKLLDFGMAKEMDQDTRLTSPGSLLGTPRYMSPEQARVGDLDARSDIYSLASVLYLALSGKDVVGGESFIQALLQLLSDDAPPLSSILPDVPGEVDLAFSVALAREPMDRPTDVEAWAGAFAPALERWQREVPGWLDDRGRMRPVIQSPQPAPRPAAEGDSGDGLVHDMTQDLQWALDMEEDPEDDR